MDISDLQRDLEQQESRDLNQDQQIQTLWRENQQLKLAVTALVQLLARKNVITPQEMQEIGRGIEG
jgi:hypothetical protein